MKNFLLISIFAVIINISNGQTLDSYYQSIVNEVTYQNIYNNLETFENFGAKGVGSAGLVNTAEWIISYYEDLGYKDIVIDTFYYSDDEVYNIIVSKTGTIYPETYFIIDGHYDTVNNSGTDDNGSGTVIVMETARVLKDIETEHSIKFIHFTAEEVGLKGSEYYVDNTVNLIDMDIKVLLNIDMVGGVATEINDIVYCERDEDGIMGNDAISAKYCDTLANLTELYSELETEFSEAFASDYIPFAENGNIIIGFFEKNWNPYYHQANDLLINMDPQYVYEICKSATSATLFFSKAYQPVDIIENKITNCIYPNPFIDEINITSENDCLLSVYDLFGNCLLNNIYLYQGINKMEFGYYQTSVFIYKINDLVTGKTEIGKLIRK
jgi:Zn-dependent M28 family amino/carboxypeptidase